MVPVLNESESSMIAVTLTSSSIIRLASKVNVIIFPELIDFIQASEEIVYPLYKLSKVTKLAECSSFRSSSPKSSKVTSVYL